MTQLVRMIALTGDVVLIVDGGRPVAAIVAADAACSRAETVAAQNRARATAAGWERRIEQVRRTVGRQYVARIRTLEDLLAEAWRLLDDRHPAGTDRTVDGARAAYHEAAAPHRT